MDICSEYHVTLVAVGALACDIILDVPFFPAKDSKIRATSFTKRRGGNVGNTLEVSQQLVKPAENQALESDGVGAGKKASATAAKVELAVIATLPARNSPSTGFITSSMNGSCEDMTAIEQRHDATACQVEAAVDMRHCLFRAQFDEPVTSYIISSSANSSRTIVNHNPLPEMEYAEFVAIVDDMIDPMAMESDRRWFHFEGRIPDVTLQCMQYLRMRMGTQAESRGSSARHPLSISVELEKPGRVGLQALAREANAVFYSRGWAEGEGYKSADDCLRRQAEFLQNNFSSQEAHPEQNEKLLICTWGSTGACGLCMPSNIDLADSIVGGTVVHSSAFKTQEMPVIDTTRAGDTFIAGMLHRLLAQDDLGILSESKAMCSHAQLKESLDFANALAGRKILQQGFANLVTWV